MKEGNVVLTRCVYVQEVKVTHEELSRFKDNQHYVVRIVRKEDKGR